MVTHKMGVSHSVFVLANLLGTFLERARVVCALHTKFVEKVLPKNNGSPVKNAGN